MNWIKKTIDSVNDNSLSKLKQRQFGVLLMAGLLLICFVSIFKEGLLFNAKQTFIAISTCVVLLISLLLPILFYPFLFVWLFLGNILGEISSFLILGIVYYVLFSPITFVLKMTNKKKTVTGWISKEQMVDYERLY